MSGNGSVVIKDKLKPAYTRGLVDFTFDCDDVIAPEEAGTHAKIKEIILDANKSGFFKTLFAGQVVDVMRNDHGHITNFPTLVYNAFRRGPRVLDQLVSKVYGGKDDFTAKHYAELEPNIDTIRFMDDATARGNRVGIYSSGPYHGHIEGVLRLTGLEKHFSYPKNVYDIVAACHNVPQKRIPSRRPNDAEIAAHYFKPSDNGYALATRTLWGKPSADRIRVFVDDDLHNLQSAIKAGDIAVWVNPIPEERVARHGQLTPHIQIGRLSELADVLDIRPQAAATKPLIQHDHS